MNSKNFHIFNSSAIFSDGQLTYGSAAFGHAAQTHIKRLESTQSVICQYCSYPTQSSMGSLSDSRRRKAEKILNTTALHHRNQELQGLMVYEPKEPRKNVPTAKTPAPSPPNIGNKKC